MHLKLKWPRERRRKEEKFQQTQPPSTQSEKTPSEPKKPWRSWFSGFKWCTETEQLRRDIRKQEKMFFAPTPTESSSQTPSAKFKLPPPSKVNYFVSLENGWLTTPSTESIEPPSSSSADNSIVVNLDGVVRIPPANGRKRPLIVLS